jgi:hypothetical protein
MNAKFLILNAKKIIFDVFSCQKLGGGLVKITRM